MVKITIDGTDYDVPVAVANLIDLISDERDLYKSIYLENKLDVEISNEG